MLVGRKTILLIFMGLSLALAVCNPCLAIAPKSVYSRGSVGAEKKTTKLQTSKQLTFKRAPISKGELFNLSDQYVEKMFCAEWNEICTALSNAKAEYIVRERYRHEAILPLHYTAFPDAEKYYFLTRALILKKAREGFAVPTLNAWHLLAGIYYHLEHDYIGSLPDDPEERLVALFRDRGIRRILQVGTGSNLSLINLLRAVMTSVGGEAFAMDWDTSLGQNEWQIRGDARYLDRYFKEKKFDLILSSGVLSPGGSSPVDSLAIADSTLKTLSDNPKAAMIANVLRSLLSLDRAEMNRKGVVELWDNFHQRDGAGYFRSGLIRAIAGREAEISLEGKLKYLYAEYFEQFAYGGIRWDRDVRVDLEPHPGLFTLYFQWLNERRAEDILRSPSLIQYVVEQRFFRPHAGDAPEREFNQALQNKATFAIVCRRTSKDSPQPIPLNEGGLNPGLRVDKQLSTSL